MSFLAWGASRDQRRRDWNAEREEVAEDEDVMLETEDERRAEDATDEDGYVFPD